VSLRMHSESAQKHEHGPCHRCGWVTDVTKVARKRAKQLHLGHHATRLCDECIDDLRQGQIVTAGNGVLGDFGRRSAPSRVVA
jgi:hypothetical protein